MTKNPDFFLKPQTKSQRKYEVLRAFHVEDVPGRQVAEQFGISYGYLRNLCLEFSQNPEMALFDSTPTEQPLPADSLKARIIALRTTHQVSIYDIRDLLKARDSRPHPPILTK